MLGLNLTLKKNYRSGALLQSFKQENFTQTLLKAFYVGLLRVVSISIKSSFQCRFLSRCELFSVANPFHVSLLYNYILFLLYTSILLSLCNYVGFCWRAWTGMNATSSKEIERSWREFLNRAYANNKARELMQDTSFLNWHMDEKLGMNSRQVEDEICVFGPMCIF